MYTTNSLYKINGVIFVCSDTVLTRDFELSKLNLISNLFEFIQPFQIIDIIIDELKWSGLQVRVL